MQPITISASVHAPIDIVWEKYNNPEDVMAWSHATDDWHTPKAENDLRVGGTFTNTMEAKDGSVSFDFVGTYTEVEKNKKIAYTIIDGRKVEVDFTEVEGGVEVTANFEPEVDNTEDMQKSGWQAILDNFKKYVEGEKLQ